MSDSAVQSAASPWRPPLPHEWDTSDRVQEMAPAEITFGELLSSLNPLQHIPVIGSLYREMTGEELHPAARVVGGALIGGPIGLVAAAFNALIEQATGRDAAGQVIALFTDKDAPSASFAAIEPAQAEPAAPQTEIASVMPPPVMPTPVADLANLTPAAGGTKPPANPNAAPGEPQGRSIAFYQNHAGQRLPQFGNMTNQRTALTGTPNPTLQRQPLEMPAPTPASIPSPAQAAAASQENASAGNEPADVFFVNAMMQGLDRYRDAKRLQRGGDVPQIDVSR
jgi:hypothetical protein